MARIIVDGTMIRERGMGASRYTVNLIRNLSKIDRENKYVIFLDKSAKVPVLPGKDNFEYYRVFSRPSLFWRLFKLPIIANRIGYDLLHIPVEFSPFMGVKRTVMTVHEIPHIRHSLQKKPTIYTRVSNLISRKLFPLCLKKANKVIAVSDSTKKDIVKIFNVDEKKITVAYEAAEEKFHDSMNLEEKLRFRREINAPEGYILNFATGDGRENNDIVLEAWDEINRRVQTSKKLVFAGCPEIKREELEKKTSKIELKSKIEILGFVDEKTLIKLYSAADIYIDISYYEGFGLQVVEAMSCGAPVIASNVASLPEIVGEGGRLVDTEDKERLVYEILDLLSNERKRRKLKKRAIVSASRFSWQKMAKDTLKVYHKGFKRRQLQ